MCETQKRISEIDFRKAPEDYIDLSEIVAFSNVKSPEGRELVIEWSKILAEKKRIKKTFYTPDEYFGLEYKNVVDLKLLKAALLECDEKLIDYEEFKNEINCSNCEYEIYFQYKDDYEMYYRDCIFKEIKIIKHNKTPIEPIIECPDFKQKNC